MTDISHLVVSVGQELKSCPDESFCLPFLSSLPSRCLWGSPTGRPDQGCRKPLRCAAYGVGTSEGCLGELTAGPGPSPARRSRRGSWEEGQLHFRPDLRSHSQSCLPHSLETAAKTRPHPQGGKTSPVSSRDTCQRVVNISVNFCENLSVFLYAYVYQWV